MGGVLTLQATEFIRRFVQHILPKGLMRIRHYGFLTNTCRKQRLAQIREALNVPPLHKPEADKSDLFSGYPCISCHEGLLRIVGICPPHRREGGG